jgi:hypothetical protein
MIYNSISFYRTIIGERNDGARLNLIFYVAIFFISEASGVLNICVESVVAPSAG